MKAIFAPAVLMIAICVGPRATHAQQPVSESAPSAGPVTFGFALGYADGTGQFAESYKSGAIDLQVQVPLAPRRLSLRGDLLWSGSPPGCFSSGPPDRFIGCPAPADMITASADIVARLNDPSTRWSPYALAGAGLYMSRGKGDRPPTPAGLEGGVGFEVRTGKRTTLFAECRYFGFGAGGVAPMTIGMRF